MKPHTKRTGSRCLLAVCVGVAVSFLLSNVPATLRGERLLQQGVQAVFYPRHQASGGTDPTSYEMLRFRNDAPAEPFVVALTEESLPDFDANPLPPPDVAVLLDQLKQAGVERVAITAPLSWPDADPFALDALEMVCANFSRCITSAVVTRSAQAEPMPAAMLRASVPLKRLRGNPRTLPVVNRIAVPQTFLGSESTWAGFSLIESEPANATDAPLLAVWGDRVIFSAALLAAMQQQAVLPEELEIVVGKVIHAPRSGQWWRIDEFGRHALQQREPREADLAAAELLRPEPAVLEKLRGHQPPVYFSPVIREEWSEVQSLHAAPCVADHVVWRSPSLATAVPLSALLSWLLAWGLGQMRWCRALVLFGMLLGWTAMLWVTQCWIPLTPLVSAGIAALCVPRLFPVRSVTSIHEPVAVAEKPEKPPASMEKEQDSASTAQLELPLVSGTADTAESEPQ